MVIDLRAMSKIMIENKKKEMEVRCSLKDFHSPKVISKTSLYNTIDDK